VDTMNALRHRNIVRNSLMFLRLTFEILIQMYDEKKRLFQSMLK